MTKAVATQAIAIFREKFGAWGPLEMLILEPRGFTLLRTNVRVFSLGLCMLSIVDRAMYIQSFRPARGTHTRIELDCFGTCQGNQKLGPVQAPNDTAVCACKVWLVANHLAEQERT